MSYEETQKMLEEYFRLKPLIMDEEATNGEDLVRFGELSNILFEKEKVLQEVHVVALVIPKIIYDRVEGIQEVLNTFTEDISPYGVEVNEYVDVVLTPEWEAKLFGEDTSA